MTTSTSHRILGTDAAVAVGRFEPSGVSGYRAKSGGPLRATRAAAERDELKTLEDAQRARHAERRSFDAPTMWGEQS